MATRAMTNEAAPPAGWRSGRFARVLTRTPVNVGLVLVHVGFGLPFAIFLLRNFFVGIPFELLEAARMDGASEFRIFFRLILPLGLPAIAALGIFQFMWVWNDLLVALIFAGPKATPM